MDQDADSSPPLRRCGVGGGCSRAASSLSPISDVPAPLVLGMPAPLKPHTISVLEDMNQGLPPRPGEADLTRVASCGMEPRSLRCSGPDRDSLPPHRSPFSAVGPAVDLPAAAALLVAAPGPADPGIVPSAMLTDGSAVNFTRIGQDVSSTVPPPMCQVSGKVKSVGPPPTVTHDCAWGIISLNLDLARDNARKFDTALVGSLLGRRIPFDVVRKELVRLWGHRGLIQLSPMGRDCFLCRFATVDARLDILTGGPWYVAGSIIGLDCWSPALSSSTLRGFSSPVWIRFPGLPLEYWDATNLGRLATSIGEPLFMDGPTRDLSRCAFARICVRLDLSRSLPIGGCGRIGHRMGACPSSPPLNPRGPQSAATMPTSSPDLTKVSGTATVPSGTTPSAPPPPVFADNGWTIVQRRKHPRTQSSASHILPRGRPSTRSRLPSRQDVTTSPPPEISQPMAVSPPPTVPPPLSTRSTSLVAPTVNSGRQSSLPQEDIVHPPSPPSAACSPPRPAGLPGDLKRHHTRKRKLTLHVSPSVGTQAIPSPPCPSLGGAGAPLLGS
ncbi:hypothetical protein M5K25_009032 [Dendrobium thyrsiflorum]|uniref:DUF4283 domain-containing protein n=1 Tax=Dendrobium thyrsiflorum TaxID=117978 RepID=A0ABD0VBG2_DENTH